MDAMIAWTCICFFVFPFVGFLFGAADDEGGMGALIGVVLWFKLACLAWIIFVVVHFVGKYW